MFLFWSIPFYINTSVPFTSNIHISKLSDFVGVQQLHSSCTFVEVVFEGDTAMPGLDFAATSP